MTLNVCEYFQNLVKKEAKISHFDVKVQAGRASKLASKFKDQLLEKYGEKYLDDADYMLIFRKEEFGFSDDDIQSLFKLVNRAFGNKANNMNEHDFKKIHFNDNDDSTNDDLLFLKITLK